MGNIVCTFNLKYSVEPIQRLLESQVRKIIEIAFIAEGARLEVAFHPRNAQSTKALSTAGHLVWLSKDNNFYCLCLQMKAND
jgi:metal-sulfur cluster biosynthetic enzyme